MTNLNIQNFNSVKNIIEGYQYTLPFKSKRKQIFHLIENYKKSNLYKSYKMKRKNRLGTIKSLVENYQTTNIYIKSQKYDLFSEMKIKLSEEELSNITADILNPKKSPFGKSILLRLLRETKKKKLAQIFTHINEENILVKREQRGDNSRIDIRIYTDLPDGNIVIDIEMKVGSGSETSHKSEKPQTVREWNDLITFANLKKVPSQNIVAYFITPHGTKAKSDDFIHLSRYKLNEIILEELDPTKKSNMIDRDGVSACRHFFSSRWLF